MHPVLRSTQNAAVGGSRILIFLMKVFSGVVQIKTNIQTYLPKVFLIFFQIRRLWHQVWPLEAVPMHSQMLILTVAATVVQSDHEMLATGVGYDPFVRQPVFQLVHAFLC